MVRGWPYDELYEELKGLSNCSKYDTASPATAAGSCASNLVKEQSC